MLKIFTVDAFADKMFSGNPTAVCLLDKNLDDGMLQNIASEMNLSETAFVKKIDDGFSLRWFTPKSEVELCGHATLASAHILWQEKIIDENQEAVFYTVYKGKLTAKKIGKEIELNFPVNVPGISNKIEDVEKAIRISPLSISTTEHHYLVELSSEAEVKNLKPDFELLEKLPKYGTIVTSKSDNGSYDFVSRFFAPSKGVKEDPVTGSAHCVLTPFWNLKLNKKTMKAFQASERGGYLTVTLENDRVLIKGKAITVLEGNLLY